MIGFYFLIFLFSSVFSPVVAAPKTPVLKTEKRTPSSYENIDDYISKLRPVREALKANEFYFILLEEGICIPLEQLKEDKKLSQSDKNQFLVEVLKTYVQILNYTNDHNPFYCLYYYFGSPENEKLISLLNKSVSKKEKEDILDYIRVCEREEKEGNGGFIGPVQEGKNLPQLNLFSFYKGMEPSKQRSYAQGFRDIYANFERDMQTGFNTEIYREMASSEQKNYSNELRKIYMDFEMEIQKITSPETKQKINHLFWDLIIKQAFAVVPQCLVGGVPRERVGGKCPTTGNPCDINNDGKKDGNTFRCGVIFNSHCVHRRYRGKLDISDRCYKAVKGKSMPVSIFESYINTTHKKVKQICDSNSIYKEACRNYSKRVKTLNQSMYNRVGDLHSSTKKCLIGGVLRNRVGGKCPTTKNSCDINGDGEPDGNTFKCGVVFNGVCVYRRYKGKLDISDRCYKASKRKLIKPEQYVEYMDEVHKDVMALCEEDKKTSRQAYREACENYNQRINTLDQHFKTSSFLMTDTQTEAKAQCTGCLTNQQQRLQPLPLSATNSKELEKTVNQVLMDTIYENADCVCKSHDGCLRGCKKRRSSTIDILCTGKKRISKSKGKCMANVRGALMKALDELTPELCGDERSTDRASCLKNSRKTPSICTKSFIFPSALCGTVLVNPDKVKGGCYKRHNQQLTSFTVKVKEGDPPTEKEKEIPLFEEVRPKPENFADIPEGAVMIGKLWRGSEYGHAEIKTDRKCSKGGNTSNCFCSDFCTVRKDKLEDTYDSTTLVVMQWNPDFLKLVSEKRKRPVAHLFSVFGKLIVKKGKESELCFKPAI